MPEDFNQKEREILEPFVTNMAKDVFVLKNLPEVVKGALFSRYSRSAKTLRRLLLDEFILDKESGFENIVGYQKSSGASEVVAIQKAEEFYDRVLVGYGDDSVAELGGAHVAVENASNILSKIVEDSRIGLSPLEKSTRYVFFDQKQNGRYLYYLEPSIMDSHFADEYVELCDELFDKYAQLVEPMKKFLQEKFPREGEVTERAYNSTIKAKACDVLRVFLPASTYTNIGLFGNGRAFEYLMTKMYAQQLKECHNVADELFVELSKTIPSFVKTVKGKYGQAAVDYMQKVNNEMKKVADYALPKEKPLELQEVVLISYEKNALDKVAAALLYQHTELSFAQVRHVVEKLSFEKKKEIIDQVFKHRSNRRHKPPRGFEHAYYEFDLLGNFGIYRDLQRHRMLTQQRQLLSTRHGFDTPKELVELGHEKDYVELMKKSANLFEKIYQKMPLQAQYVVPFGHRLRWSLNINLRELYHFVELRSGIQGHVDYRRMVLKMLEEVKKVQPDLVQGMKYADYREVGLERLESEKKIDEKLKRLLEKN